MSAPLTRTRPSLSRSYVWVQTRHGKSEGHTSPTVRHGYEWREERGTTTTRLKVVLVFLVFRLLPVSVHYHSSELSVDCK